MNITKVQLDDIVTISGGGTPSKAKPEYFTGKIPWVSPKDMKFWDIVDSQDHITEEAIKQSTAKLIPPGAILIVIRSGVLKHSLPIGINQVSVAINQDMKALTCSDRVDAKYLARFLQSNAGNLLTNVRGTTADNIPTDALRQVQVPLPPLSEQKRIAEILDRAEALRAKRRAALALLDELTQSIFLDTFGDAEVKDSRWPIVKIGEYVSEFQGGKSLASDEDATSVNRVLKVSAVTGMKFRPMESKPVPDTYTPPIEHFVKPNDLLFSRANTTELVGAVAYVSNCPENLLLPDKLWRFVWKNPDEIHPLFIWFLFQTRPVRREIGNRATGTSGSMKNISKAKLNGIPTILPPFDMQKLFADRVEFVENAKTVVRKSLAELDQLFASLQHRAFRGEL